MRRSEIACLLNVSDKSMLLILMIITVIVSAIVMRVFLNAVQRHEDNFVRQQHREDNFVEQQNEILSIGGGTSKNIYKDLNEYPESKFEASARNSIELLTGHKFRCVYPSWLIYKGKQLELDGYNEDLKLAFETQGPQHSKYSPKYDKSYKKYEQRLLRDQAKVDLALKNNVGLIIIDYKIPAHLLGAYIRSRIYDIAQQWERQGLHRQLKKLGDLVHKPGNYITVIAPRVHVVHGL